MELIRPFGPTIGKATIEDDIYKNLLTITDDLLKNPDRVNMSHTLAGQIKEQIEVPKSLLIEHGLIDFFEFYLDTFLSNLGIDYSKSIKLGPVWLNSMYKHEWKPPHIHNGFLSTILILKLPDLPPKQGELTFINNSGRTAFELEAGLIDYTPQEKDFFMFPARLNHSVSPFTCEGERRTMSFNAFLQGSPIFGNDQL